MRKLAVGGLFLMFVTGCTSELPAERVGAFSSDPAIGLTIAQIQGGDVSVKIAATNFKIVPPASATEHHKFGEGHVHLFLDIPPTAPGEVIPKIPGVFHVADTQTVLHDVTNGHHVLIGVLGYSDHLPYEHWSYDAKTRNYSGAIARVEFTVTGSSAVATAPSPSPTAAPTSAPTALPSVAPSPTQSGPVSANSVKVVPNADNGGAYDPSSLSVSKGTTITWTWTDPNSQHSVTGSNFDSGLQGNGYTFKYTFTATGTFDYHCTIHPAMTGSVTVT